MWHRSWQSGGHHRRSYRFCGRWSSWSGNGNTAPSLPHTNPPPTVRCRGMQGDAEGLEEAVALLLFTSESAGSSQVKSNNGARQEEEERASVEFELRDEDHSDDEPHVGTLLFCSGERTASSTWRASRVLIWRRPQPLFHRTLQNRCVAVY